MPVGRFNPPSVAYYSATPSSTTAPFVTLNLGDQPWLTAFGSVGGACTLTLYYSNDGVTWYASQNKQVLAGAGGFAIDATTGAAYVGIVTSAEVAITAYLSAKG